MACGAAPTRLPAATARLCSKGSALVTKPVVLIAEELSPATIDALGPDFDVRQVDGTDRPALAAAPALKVIARAGVGLDNVDIKAATTAGVMVVNAPTSNIISAAELTVGNIGLGRIGALIAARLNAFDMRVIAYDPYVTSARAQQLGVQLVTLDELVESSDFITIHMPKTPETTGMIGAEQLK